MTYNFKVVVEPDGPRWHAWCPALLTAGASTWGYTRQEALRNIREVVQMVVDSLLEHGDPLPSEPSEDVDILPDPRVAVIV
jgi:predicted RNase H-like HicB family nuclease